MTFFIFAASFKTDKVTDISYSLSFFILAPALLIVSGPVTIGVRLIVTVAIMIWASRLGFYLLKRIITIGKDDRFDDKRDHFLSFLQFWILQTLVVWIVMLPFSLFLTSSSVKTSLITSVSGIVLFAAGLLIEGVSDQQKFSYKNDTANEGHWMDQGLWKFSRHPNYFGEILLWWGLFIIVTPQLKGFEWLTILGPVTITLFLLFVSGIPLLEKSAEKKYGNNPDYKNYRESTSLLIPLPPRKGSHSS